MRLGDAVARVTRALGVKPCAPCEARRRRLNRLFGGEEELMKTRRKYRIDSGRYRRFEGTTLVSYRVNDVVLLDEREARVMYKRITPVDDETEEGGTPQFTPQDAPLATAAELRTIVAGTTDVGRLRDIEEAERAGEGRVSVIRAVEKRAREIEREEAEATAAEANEEEAAG